MMMNRSASPPRKRCEAQARIAKALAHPSRLMLLHAVKNRELCVCDLTGLIGADQSTVSKHLAVLRGVGLIGMRKEGANAYYRATCACLSGFFDCLDTVLHANLKEQQACLSC